MKGDGRADPVARSVVRLPSGSFWSRVTRQMPAEKNAASTMPSAASSLIRVVDVIANTVAVPSSPARVAPAKIATRWSPDSIFAADS